MIKIKKNQHAMFHTLDLNTEEIDYIITHINAVHFIREREKYCKKCYNSNDINKYEFVRNEFEIIERLKNKLDIWDYK